MSLSEISHLTPIEHDKIRSFPQRILVAGTRGFMNYKVFCRELEAFLKELGFDKKDIVFISGDARTGADALIIRYAQEHGYNYSKHTPKWDVITGDEVVVKYNRRGAAYNALAGFIRNREMAEYANRLLTFYDGTSPGTRDMMERMTELRHPVRCLIIPKELFEDENG